MVQSTVQRFRRSREAVPSAVVEQERAGRLREGARRGGVGLAVAAVESRFGPVEARDRVAELPGEPRDGGRSAEAGEDQVGGAVVAMRDGGAAQGLDAHPALAEMGLGVGRVADIEVWRPIGDPAVQPLRSRIDPLEHRPDGYELGGRTHEEALVGAMSEAAARAGVERKNARAASGPRFERRESVFGGGGREGQANGYGRETRQHGAA